MRNPNILVAVTAYGGAVKNGCTVSLLRLQESFHQKGMPFRFLLQDAADISSVRNLIATKVLEDKSYSHLLFVDNDIEFEPAVVFGLVERDKRVIGCAIQRRDINLKRALQLARDGASDDVALARASDFCVRYESINTNVYVKKGAIQVAGIGMGLTLISREALDGLFATGKIALHQKHPLSRYTDAPLYGFFDPVEGLSEDFSFCERWRKLCNGEIWAVITDQACHIGDFSFVSRYEDKIRAGEA